SGDELTDRHAFARASFVYAVNRRIAPRFTGPPVPTEVAPSHGKVRRSRYWLSLSSEIDANLYSGARNGDGMVLHGDENHLNTGDANGIGADFALVSGESQTYIYVPLRSRKGSHHVATRSLGSV